MVSNTAEFYDAIYTKTPSKWNIPMRDAVAHDVISKFIKPRSIVDIGCGNGHTLAYLAERMPEAKLYGLDLSPEAIRLCKENLPGATFWSGEFGKFPLPYVDLAIAMGVAEHFIFLDDFFKALSETAAYAYIESPNCLKYSNVKQEGYRETYRGAGQAEWHLYRPSWDRVIVRHFEIVVSVHGTTDTTEYIWLLKSKRQLTGHPVLDQVVAPLSSETAPV